MGTGCQTVSRTHTPDTDIAVGVWEGNRIGSYRGLRRGQLGYGGNAFCEKAIKPFGQPGGMPALLKNIVKMYQTGIPPVAADVTLEIYTFMEAADESKRRGGLLVSLAETKQKALVQLKKSW